MTPESEAWLRTTITVFGACVFSGAASWVAVKVNIATLTTWALQHEKLDEARYEELKRRLERIEHSLGISGTGDSVFLPRHEAERMVEARNARFGEVERRLLEIERSHK